MHELMNRPHRRKIEEMPIAPILDMMVAVIFFLLLSTTFIEFTKQTLQPVEIRTTQMAQGPLPLSPKLFTTRTKEWLSLNLTWSGERPGHLKKNITNVDPLQFSKDLINVSRELATEFHQRFPAESNVQLSFGPDIFYQEIISVMDGVQSQIPNVLLTSYDEALRQQRALNE